MKFEIPFNPALYREKTIDAFNHLWYTRVRNTHLLLAQAILITGIGVWFLASGLGVANAGYVFIAVGLHLAINCINYYINISKHRRKQHRLIEAAVQKWKNTTGVLEFTKEAFHYTTNGVAITLSWDNCTSFKVINKNSVLLYFDTSATPAFIISKKEVTQEGFNDIISFLEDRNWYPTAMPSV